MKPQPADPFTKIPDGLTIMTWTYVGRTDRAGQLPRKDFGLDREVARAHVLRQVAMDGTAKVHICATGPRDDGSWPQYRIDCYPDGRLSPLRYRDAALRKGSNRFPDADGEHAGMLDLLAA